MILFDLGGVLIENAGFDALGDLLPTPLKRAALRDRWITSPSVRDFELGRIDAHDFATGFVTEWGLDASPSDFIEQFAQWPRGPFPGAANLVATLRERHYVACLSNCNPMHWERFSEYVGWFHAAFSSHLLGAVKPDAAAFAAVLSATSSDAADVVFLDDAEVNVEAARSMGIGAHRVDGVAQARRVLEGLGVLGQA